MLARNALSQRRNLALPYVLSPIACTPSGSKVATKHPSQIFPTLPHKDYSTPKSLSGEARALTAIAVVTPWLPSFTPVDP